MSHLDRSTLATYNSLVDPNLQSYFSNDRIRSHLRNAGLVSGRGEIVSDGEYRSRLAQREHRKHVRHMLAENIVNRAIDIERDRHAKMKRQFEEMTKLALVHNVKESKRRSGNMSGLMTNSVDMGLLSINSSWSQIRPKSANHQNEMDNEHTHIPRIQSAHISVDDGGKYSSKNDNRLPRRRRRVRSLQRSKSSNKNRTSSAQRPRSPAKQSESSPCQVTMVYYGPNTKIDYDHLVFEPTDEIIVMQQHCGGENIPVYKNHLKAGAEFSFNSRRHSDYPFGLSLYINGLIDSRISTCCEHKHRHGVRLGGDRGYFAIKSVQGSKECIKCRFEKHARLKKYAQSPKDKNNENNQPIIISIPVSDQSQQRQTPVKIPVRHSSTSNENYSEDFDGSDKQKDNSSAREQKSKSKVVQRKSNSSLDTTPREESTKKTWQIVFHSSNISTENNLLLKFSFLGKNRKDETEIYEINMKQFTAKSKSTKQYSFSVKLKDIGKPEQIRLKLHLIDDDDDDDDDEDIKWQLDHIELIDPKTQVHSIFPCKQWIRPAQEKILQLSQDSSRDKRDSFSSSDDSRPAPSNQKHRHQSSSDERKQKPSTSKNGSKPPPSNHQQPSRDARKSSSDSDVSIPSPSTQKNRQQSPSDERKQKASTNKNDSKPSLSSRDERKRKSSSNSDTSKPSPPDERKRKSSSDSDDFKPSPSNQKNRQQSPSDEQKQKASTTKNDSKPSQDEQKRKTSINSDDSRPSSSTHKNHQQSPKLEQTAKTSSRSSTPTNVSKQLPTKSDSTENQSNQKQKSISHSDQEDNQIHYRVTICPSTDNDGKFNPVENSRIFLRLNNQSKEINLTTKTDQSCPTFKAGEAQTFELDFLQNNNEQPNKLTIGYINSDNSASKWKLEKIVLINTETKEEVIFPCKENLIRQESNFRAEQTFEIQSKESDDESTPRNRKINSGHEEEIITSQKQQTDENNKERSRSFQSMTDADAHYSLIFKQTDPENELELGSQPPSPTSLSKTKNGRQDQSVDSHQIDHTARSNNQNSLPSTTTNNTQNHFKRNSSTNDDNQDN